MLGRPALVFAALLMVPTSGAQYSLFLGSEDLPELVDRAGDVNYQPSPFGDPTHKWLDILSGWFEHDASSDRLNFTARIGDASGLKNPRPGWHVRWVFEGRVTLQNESVGLLGFDARLLPNGTWTSDAYAGTVSRVRSNNIDDHWKSMPHGFEAVLTDPGYLRFTLARSEALKVGDSWDRPRAQSTGLLNPAYNQACPCGFASGDAAESNGSYSFEQGRQIQRHDGAGDPIEEFARTMTETPASTTTTEAQTSTPWVGSVPLQFAVLAASCLAWHRARVR